MKLELDMDKIADALGAERGGSVVDMKIKALLLKAFYDEEKYNNVENEYEFITGTAARARKKAKKLYEFRVLEFSSSIYEILRKGLNIALENGVTNKYIIYWFLKRLRATSLVMWRCVRLSETDRAPSIFQQLNSILTNEY